MCENMESEISASSREYRRGTDRVDIVSDTDDTLSAPVWRRRADGRAYREPEDPVMTLSLSVPDTAESVSPVSDDEKSENPDRNVRRTRTAADALRCTMKTERIVCEYDNQRTCHPVPQQRGRSSCSFTDLPEHITDENWLLTAHDGVHGLLQRLAAVCCAWCGFHETLWSNRP